MYKIYLASSSPRRKELLTKIGYNFTVIKPKIDESFDDSLSLTENIEDVSLRKAVAASKLLKDPKPLIIAGDTIVVMDNQVLGKPKSEAEAKEMLTLLSQNTHQVISAYTIWTAEKVVTKHIPTRVTMGKLSPQEIDLYIQRYKPMDKAGAYGIQEWIGMIGVQSIEGDYYNVMGMPTQALYETLTHEYGVYPA